MTSEGGIDRRIAVAKQALLACAVVAIRASLGFCGRKIPDVR
jgi:hypothetical protein